MRSFVISLISTASRFKLSSLGKYERLEFLQTHWVKYFWTFSSKLIRYKKLGLYKIHQ